MIDASQIVKRSAFKFLVVAATTLSTVFWSAGISAAAASTPDCANLAVNAENLIKQFSFLVLSQNRNVSTQTATKLFEALNLDLNLICDYPECQTKATHFLVCPVCRASENMCGPHTVLANLAPEDEWVVFDRSCMHRVLMCECSKVPIN